MKTKLLTAVCAASVLLASSSSASASPKIDATSMASDVLVVRPVCLVATILGSAIFVVSLPVAAISKSVKPAASALVVSPAKATFTRPLGDLDTLVDY